MKTRDVLPSTTILYYYNFDGCVPLKLRKKRLYQLPGCCLLLSSSSATVGLQDEGESPASSHFETKTSSSFLLANSSSWQQQEACSERGFVTAILY